MSRVLLRLVRDHNPGLVLAAVIICLVAAFFTFAMLSQAHDGNRRRLVWIWLAAAAAGIGIWSMHFILMLGLNPASKLSYDYIGLFASIIPAILNAGIGFTFCGRERGSTWLAGTFIGAGFAMMHYMWASAVRVVGTIIWHWDMVAVSIASCIGFSLAAVALYRSKPARNIMYPALLLALAMASLHVIAMGAAELHHEGHMTTLRQVLDPEALAIVITITSLVILSIALGVAFVDRIGMNRKLAEAAEFKRLADEVMAGAAERERLLAELKRQYEISSAALENMVHGLSMFDKNGSLVVFNRRYLEMYQIPDNAINPGTSYHDMLRYHFELGQIPGSWTDWERRLTDLKPDFDSREVLLRDGRIFDIHSRHLESGGWITTHEDITDRRRASDRIAYLATRDELTGLPNRRSFAEALSSAADAAKQGQGFALLTVDLDRFKEVNDTLGHPIGDQILTETASRLRSIAREQDVVTRLGGDEFAILQHDLISADDAARFAALIVGLLSKPYHFDGHTVTVGGTVGIAFASPGECDAEEIVKRSDLALYRAKHQCRGSYCFFEPGMDARLLARRELEMGLRVALQNAEFELFYQPLLDVKSGRIVSFEALIRWHHPTRGLLQPIEFIATAEDSGLIIPIGEWVLRQACKDAVRWPSDIHVSVNLSAAQLKRGDLLAMTKSALGAAGLTPERLEIELTESVLLHDEQWVRAQLVQLRELGVRIAMDDFGTGYSSLSYLRTFPFSKIKIDKSFIADMSGNKDALAIVQATIDLSVKLGMCTTAEGVETEEQLVMLTAEGCTQVQGYCISPPVPRDEIWDILGQYTSREAPVLRVAS
jgi:diguanylate cyclase (GGDEF)-like protein